MRKAPWQSTTLYILFVGYRDSHAAGITPTAKTHGVISPLRDGKCETLGLVTAGIVTSVSTVGGKLGYHIPGICAWPGERDVAALLRGDDVVGKMLGIRNNSHGAGE